MGAVISSIQTSSVKSEELLCRFSLNLCIFCFRSGRVSAKTLSKRDKFDLSREQRKNKAKQIRAAKKEEALQRKRSLGSHSHPPFLVTVVPLSPSINPRTVLTALKECDEAATVTTSSQGITHIKYAHNDRHTIYQFFGVSYFDFMFQHLANLMQIRHQNLQIWHSYCTATHLTASRLGLYWCICIFNFRVSLSTDLLSKLPILKTDLLRHIFTWCKLFW